MKGIVYAAARTSGLNGAARALFRSRLLVVCFHGVCVDRPDVPDPAGMHVPAELFEEQVRFLADRYHPVGLDDVRRACLDGAALPPEAVLVTFDDGYSNVGENALPILRRYRVPSVLFVVPSAIDGSPATTLVGSLMTWADLKAVVPEDLVAVGSHGLHHERLATCGPEQLELEVAESRRRLVDELGVDVDAIAYPYGSVSGQVASAARTAGYRLGFTTAHKHMDKGGDPLLIPRVLVGARDTRSVLGARLAGWTEWLRPLRRSG
jgi:peptidoglycan/xylan/chitin deacetylase (PgdA/CDA1 family)